MADHANEVTAALDVEAGHDERFGGDVVSRMTFNRKVQCVALARRSTADERWHAHLHVVLACRQRHIKIRRRGKITADIQLPAIDVLDDGVAG